jgi:hypothetical protein
VKEVKERIVQLRPNSVRVWGKMNPGQALAHCARGIELAVGDRMPPRMWLGRIIGRIVKPMAHRNGNRFRMDIETDKSYVAHDRLLRMWLCVVQSPTRSVTHDAANRSRSFHCD